MAWVLDLDGVVWLGDEVIPGAVEAVRRLRAAGEQVAFVTNNSYPTRGELAAKLDWLGVDPGEGGQDVLSSATAAASLLEPGERALVVGGPGIVEALTERGVELVPEAPADAVVVGINPAFDYQMMTVASAAVRQGARLVATNDDATYPTPRGPIPGGGAILASIATASGSEPTVAGKPHEALTRITRDRLGESGWCVGDRAGTDGELARALGYRFVLVLSGVTGEADLPVVPEPDLVCEHLGAAVDSLLR